jgi:hypothetical protein
MWTGGWPRGARQPTGEEVCRTCQRDYMIKDKQMICNNINVIRHKMTNITCVNITDGIIIQE